jgi:hypothetical protein
VQSSSATLSLSHTFLGVGKPYKAKNNIPYKQLQCATCWLSAMFAKLHSCLVAYFVQILVLNLCKTECFSGFSWSF